MATSTSRPQQSIDNTGAIPSTHLHLHGVEDDRARLKRLAKRLRRLGIDCSLTLWRLDRKVQPRGGSPEHEAPSEAGAQNTICWTRRSIDLHQQALHGFAIACKTQGSYLGLILDDVTPPQTVTGAEDIKLVGWDWAEGGRTVAPLLDFLQIRRRYQGGMLSGLTRGIGRVWSAMVDIYDRLERVYVISIISLLIATFGFLGGLIGNTTGMCMLPGIRSGCAWAGIGSAPTDAQTAEWKRIETTKDCKILEAYRDRIGQDGPYAATIERRLTIKRPVEGVKVNVTELTLPYWEQAFQPTREKAVAALNAAAGSEARKLCERQAQSFLGLAGPGSYTLQSPASCVQDAEGQRCSASIEVTCRFRAKDEGAICPP